MTKKQHILFVLCIFLTGFMGCGKAPNPDGREDVWGQITLNGEPVRTGMIAFRSQEKEGRDGEAGGSITKGKFFLTGRDGVKPGEYKVVLFATDEYDIQTGELPTFETTADRLRSVDLIPAEFNSKSTLTFTVEKGKKNIFDYDVVAEPPKVPKK